MLIINKAKYNNLNLYYLVFLESIFWHSNIHMRIIPITNILRMRVNTLYKEFEY